MFNGMFATTKKAQLTSSRRLLAFEQTLGKL
jgi:hypothetical protein